ncbi:hypothetical protein KBTX_03674 [wastewater metagenome]|uniref:DUF427 domain-containing protein n=2 Tax=unclassified sequences TaxID=12908 RepID=A0A5B8RJQ0_9ZZZZ|nr:DUF427 domain-containing protein [Arhodomonas sp. KWT]QEA07325.1 hypothetical protein KBTEX_03674 [uncultured organism]
MAESHAADRIRLTQGAGRVRVLLDGHRLADSTDVIELHETGYPVRYYFPRAGVEMGLLTPSATRTHCPLKGEAEYFGVRTGSAVVTDGAWSYPAPLPAMAPIAGRLAFDGEQVQIVTA